MADGKIAMLRLTINPGFKPVDAVAGAMAPLFQKHPEGVTLTCHACGWRGVWKHAGEVPTKTLPCPAIEGRYHVRID